MLASNTEFVILRASDLKEEGGVHRLKVPGGPESEEESSEGESAEEALEGGNEEEEEESEESSEESKGEGDNALDASQD